MTAPDELEIKLRAAFGERAAEIDLRAREVSGLDPAADVKFPGPKDGDGCLFALLGITTVRRLLGVVLCAAVMAPFADALVSILGYPS